MANIRKYSQKFKDEAIRVVLESGYSVPEACKMLGILSVLL